MQKVKKETQYVLLALVVLCGFTEIRLTEKRATENSATTQQLFSWQYMKKGHNE